MLYKTLLIFAGPLFEQKVEIAHFNVSAVENFRSSLIVEKILGHKQIYIFSENDSCCFRQLPCGLVQVFSQNIGCFVATFSCQSIINKYSLNRSYTENYQGDANVVHVNMKNVKQLLISVKEFIYFEIKPTVFLKRTLLTHPASLISV